jgi:hypothetical protein
MEALASLDDSLTRVSLLPADSATTQSKAQREEMDDLIRDLTLDIDLRTNGASNRLMTHVESDVYLPAIEKILCILALESPSFSDQLSCRLDAAKELAKDALRQASLRRV